MVGGEAMSGDWLSLGAPSTHRMSSWNHTRHVHGVGVHVHWSTHLRVLLSWGLEW